jgi:hypothetical protein
MKSKRRTGRLALLGLAVLGLLGVGIAVQAGGCAESKLQKQISAQDAAAATADAAGQAAAAHAAAIDKATKDAAAAAIPAGGGPMDAEVFYNELRGRLSDPADQAKIVAAVQGGTAPAAAGSTLLAQAQADAAKYAQQAADARAEADNLRSQLAAAHASDTSTWTQVISSAGGLANLWIPGLGTVIGALGTLGVQKLRGTTYTDGQADGATQVAQGVATLRKAVPAVDKALDAVGPLLKAIVNSTMDDHVAAAVAENKDTVAPDAADTVLATLGPPAPATAAA